MNGTHVPIGEGGEVLGGAGGALTGRKFPNAKSVKKQPKSAPKVDTTSMSPTFEGSGMTEAACKTMECDWSRTLTSKETWLEDIISEKILKPHEENREWFEKMTGKSAWKRACFFNTPKVHYN